MKISQIRNETKGTKTSVHFNNAGAALMPDVVLETMKAHLDLEAQVGGYEAAALREKEAQNCYESIAKYLNCEAKNIALTTSATDGYSRALSSIPFAAGDIILTTESDYISNHIAFLSLQKRFSIFVRSVPNDESGQIDVKEFEATIRKINPKLVAVTHIPTNSGLIQPLEEIGQLCRKYDVLYMVDICQSVGQLPLNVQSIHCDFATATARKFLRGPRGMGFMYISDKALNAGFEPMFLDMRGADWVTEKSYRIKPTAMRYEDWEFSYSNVLGMGAAVEYMLEIGIENIEKRNQELCAYLIGKLKNIEGLKVVDNAPKLSSIVIVAFDKHSPSEIKEQLLMQHINTSISSRSSALIDFTKKNIIDALRISPHYYNTNEEIDVLVAALEKLTK